MWPLRVLYNFILFLENLRPFEPVGLGWLHCPSLKEVVVWKVEGSYETRVLGFGLRLGGRERGRRAESETCESLEIYAISIVKRESFNHMLFRLT